MPDDDHHDLVERIIEDNKYLALSTTDEFAPWVAPLEYLTDDVGNLYFGSPTSSRHARHIEDNETVAVAIWESEQPAIGPTVSTTLNGVQMRAEAGKLSSEEYPQVVVEYIEDGPEPEMPPYAVYRIEPRRVYVPVVEEGVNERVEIDWPE